MFIMVIQGHRLVELPFKCLYSQHHGREKEPSRVSNWHLNTFAYEERNHFCSHSLARISHVVLPTEEAHGHQPTTVYPEGNELVIVNSSDGCHTKNTFMAETIFNETNWRKYTFRF